MIQAFMFSYGRPRVDIQTKIFNDEAAANDWINKNCNKYQYSQIMTNSKDIKNMWDYLDRLAHIEEEYGII